jgi:hypothetical protein
MMASSVDSGELAQSDRSSRLAGIDERDAFWYVTRYDKWLVTSTRRDGDAIGVLLDEIREHLTAASDHLKRHRYVLAVQSAHQAELRRAEAAALLADTLDTGRLQRLELLHTELKVVNLRIRLAIGI